MKPTRANFFIGTLVLLTVILSAVTLSVLLFNQKAVPTLGPQGAQGKPGVVDYRKVNNYIDQAISDAPKAKDGVSPTVDYQALDQYIASYVNQQVLNLPPPVNGSNGSDGKNGSSCTTTQIDTGAAITCTDGTSSVVTNGADGQNAYTELRCNTNKNRWEVRYQPDGSWLLLNGKVVACTVIPNGN